MRLLMILVLVAAAACASTVGAYMGGQVAQIAVNRAVECKQSYDRWVASNYPTPYIDPCTGMSLSGVRTFAPITFPTFAPTAFPSFEPLSP